MLFAGADSGENKQMQENTLQLEVEQHLQGVPFGAQALYRRLEEHHQETAAHARRTARYAMQLALESGRFNDAQVADIWLGALLHDIGKIAVPLAILDKPGGLSAPEWEVIRCHTLWGEQLIKPFVSDHPIVLEAVRSEHERFDGRGYPDGLSGKWIPDSARIIMVCDTFDAVTHARSYRPGRSPEKAIEILIAGAGSQFDPYWVGIAIRAWASSKITPPAILREGQSTRESATHFEAA
ncbi:MAG: hypothetical protein COB96_03330 [Planctomycetota bacterium]|jgi:HD-GYP domain-containing protein (c-di-GMP phosphodiesterase class II)|nr:MAG: hypothetical protein COB96_03330 [Planctomycetota bacterium]